MLMLKMNQVFAKEMPAPYNIALTNVIKTKVPKVIHSLNGVTLQMIRTLKVFALPIVQTTLHVLIILVLMV